MARTALTSPARLRPRVSGRARTGRATPTPAGLGPSRQGARRAGVETGIYQFASRAADARAARTRLDREGRGRPGPGRRRNERGGAFTAYRAGRPGTFPPRLFVGAVLRRPSAPHPRKDNDRTSSSTRHPSNKRPPRISATFMTARNHPQTFLERHGHWRNAPPARGRRGKTGQGPQRVGGQEDEPKTFVLSLRKMQKNFMPIHGNELHQRPLFLHPQ